MKNEIELNVTYNNDTAKNNNYILSFINSIEDTFKEKGMLLEAKRIAEADNPVKEVLTILNDEVISSSDIRMEFFKQER